MSLLMVDGYFPRQQLSVYIMIIFICIVMKIIFPPFSLTVLQDGIFVGSCVMSLSDRALETQRLLLLLFHLQDANTKAVSRGLSQGSTEGWNNFSVLLAYWDPKGWRLEEWEIWNTHNVWVNWTSCLSQFIVQETFLECLLHQALF